MVPNEGIKRNVLIVYSNVSGIIKFLLNITVRGGRVGWLFCRLCFVGISCDRRMDIFCVCGDVKKLYK